MQHFLGKPPGNVAVTSMQSSTTKIFKNRIDIECISHSKMYVLLVMFMQTSGNVHVTLKTNAFKIKANEVKQRNVKNAISYYTINKTLNKPSNQGAHLER